MTLDPLPARARGRGAHVRHPARRPRGQRRDPRDRPVGGRAARPRAAARRRPTSPLRPHGAAARRRRAGAAHVEYQGSGRRGARRARRGCARSPASSARVRLDWLEDPAALAEAAALRRAVLPLLMGAPGAERPASFVEDTAVAPERLADFVDEFERLVRGRRRARLVHGARLGRLHARPSAARPQDGGRRARMEALAVAVGAPGRRVPRRHLRRARLRPLAQLVPARLLGREALRGHGGAQGRLRPAAPAGAGHHRRRPRRRRDLRFGADYRGRRRLDAAALVRRRGRLRPGRRAGASAPGSARRPPGTMCPPAAVDRERGAAARGRGPTRCRASLCGAVPLAAIGDDEFREVLGTCVACKACKTECPAGVDMAALKVEWLAEVRAREGVPALARGIGEFRRLAALASPLAPLVNALARTRAARAWSPTASAWPTAAAAAARSRGGRSPARAAPRRAAAAEVGALRRLLRAVPGAAGRRGAGARCCAPPASSSRSWTPAAAGARRSRPGRSTRRAPRPRRALGRARTRSARRRAICSSSSPAACRWCATTGGGCCRATRASAEVAAAARPALALVADAGRGRAACASAPAAARCCTATATRRRWSSRRRHRARAARRARSRARGPRRRLLRHVRRLRLRGRALRAQRGHGRARAAAGGARRGGRTRPCWRPAPRAGRRSATSPAAAPAPARVPRRRLGAPLRHVASRRRARACTDGRRETRRSSSPAIAGWPRGGYGFCRADGRRLAPPPVPGYRPGAGVALASWSLLIAYGDRLLR